MKPINYDNYYWQSDLVRLRAMREEDWEEGFPSYYDNRARFLLDEHIELPPLEETVREEYRSFANFNQDKGRIMITIETLDGRNVGGLNLNGIDERNGTFSIGIQIHVGERGKGYGTAAMRLLLRYAFLERRLNKFNSGWVEGNEASEAMHRTLGCVEEGHRRQICYSGGNYLGDYLVGLTKDEFLENEKQYLQ